MVIVVLMVVLLQKIHFSEDDWWKKSVLVPHVKKLVNEVPKHLPQEIIIFVDKTSNSFVVTGLCHKSLSILLLKVKWVQLRAVSQNNT